MPLPAYSYQCPVTCGLDGPHELPFPLLTLFASLSTLSQTPYCRERTVEQWAEFKVSKQLMLVSAIAAILGVAVGYLVGFRSIGAFRDLSDVHRATASHTKTYVSIAHLIRKGNQQGALKLADAMIDVGASSLNPVPQELDAEDKAHLSNVLSAVHQYRSARQRQGLLFTESGL